MPAHLDRASGVGMERAAVAIAGVKAVQAVRRFGGGANCLVL